MTAAAFSATYSDWRVIKGRKVVQVVFELPLEKADEAYQVLGGMPIAASEVWCAVARLGSSGGDTRQEGSGDSCASMQSSAAPSHSKKSPAQIAGYLCTLPTFHKFLQEKFTEVWWRNSAPSRATEEEIAKQCIYDICTVTSRTQLTKENTEWNALQIAFQLWERHPELEDA